MFQRLPPLARTGRSRPALRWPWLLALWLYWIAALGAEPSDTVPPAGDYPEFRGDVSAAVEQAIAKVGADAESFSITSDLDYMPFLEAGWSEQAPAGFIALTFREAAEQLGQMAREA